MSNPDSAAPHAAAQPHAVHVAQAPSRFSGPGATALLIATVFVFGIAFLFLWQMKQFTAQPATAEQGDIASLRDRLVSDEARLAVLEKAGPGEALRTSLQQVQSDLATMSARIAKLETAPDPQAAARLDDLDKRLANIRTDIDLRVAALERNVLNSEMPQKMAAMTAAQSLLEARIARLERMDPSVTMRRAAAELALANLVRASGDSGPFVAELNSFHALMPDAPEAAELIPVSRTGAPTRAELAARFPDVATSALTAENSARPRSWLGRLWSNIGNLIVVRRIGDTKGADSESILARTGAHLDRGDLAGAITEMRLLKGNARTMAQPWLSDAQARLTIERDLAIIANRMTKLLAAP
jgi:hypothetical protein